MQNNKGKPAVLCNGFVSAKQRNADGLRQYWGALWRNQAVSAEQFQVLAQWFSGKQFHTIFMHIYSANSGNGKIFLSEIEIESLKGRQLEKTITNARKPMGGADVDKPLVEMTLNEEYFLTKSELPVILIFASDRGLDCCACTNWSIDGTFFCCPKNLCTTLNNQSLQGCFYSTCCLRPTSRQEEQKGLVDLYQTLAVKVLLRSLTLSPTFHTMKFLLVSTSWILFGEKITNGVIPENKCEALREYIANIKRTYVGRKNGEVATYPIKSWNCWSSVVNNLPRTNNGYQRMAQGVQQAIFEKKPQLESFHCATQEEKMQLGNGESTKAVNSELQIFKLINDAVKFFHLRERVPSCVESSIN
uniref:Uncharacterized protein n=1 Tax=Ditylenchus dipsaci TaxID=166011 RepID=A0A915DV10_9BILA